MLPADKWFTGLRNFVTHRITLLVSGLLVATLVLSVAHDHLRQHQVAITLRQLMALQPGQVNASEVIAFARKNRFASTSPSGEKEVNCDEKDCDFRKIIEADSLISWLATRGSEFTGIKAAWLEGLGIKPWGVMFEIRLADGHLVRSGVEFATAAPIPHHPYEGWRWNNVSVGFTEDSRNEFSQYDRYRDRGTLVRSPNYGVWALKNAFVVVAGTEATKDELRTAFSFDLGCLSKHPCPRWGDVVPFAWKRFCSELSTESYLQRECLPE